jgi:hypothetical protein
MKKQKAKPRPERGTQQRIPLRGAVVHTQTVRCEVSLRRHLESSDGYGQVVWEVHLQPKSFSGPPVIIKGGPTTESQCPFTLGAEYKLDLRVITPTERSLTF